MRRFRSAHSLISELGITNPQEIDINAIAEYCNAHIEYCELKGCEGRILGNDTNSIITVSTSIPNNRQRFTAAHELGHWMCDRGKTAIAFSDTEETIELGWNPKSREIRANEYAAEILMPTALFKPKCRKSRPSFTFIEKLATAFHTSLTATAFRYISCTDERCAIVFSKDGHIRNFNSSANFGCWIPVGSPLDKYALAYDFFNGKALSPRMESVDASTWLEGKYKNDAMIKEESRALPHYNMVMSLIWIDSDIDIDYGAWDDRESFTPDGKYRKR